MNVGIDELANRESHFGSERAAFGFCLDHGRDVRSACQCRAAWDQGVASGWQGSATLADLYAYKYQETRVAGFGPFFSGCLILAFLLGLILIVTTRSVRWPLVSMATVLICSLLLSRHLWWLRYGLQLWLVPILPIAFAFQLRVSRYKLTLALRPFAMGGQCQRHFAPAA